MIRFLGLKLSLNKLETNKKTKRKNNPYERTESEIHFGKENDAGVKQVK
ncbi:MULTISPECIES: hypothetical protein [Leptospira]|uniref:Uncharacterized protein n=1 Tax=Leptospira borgpetersenii serovar Ballum TaxID=280505 RepID=A0A0S2ITV2_LEPBO|nr:MULTISPECIES: hypothetical protein [Leptospira]ALO27081.1 hypothetical protein LBBP_02865 [Leptospira borgpetersenii serovar Ballum]MBE8161084.1 hypothetical protein [Leptospira borgpetersenii serovar Ballum]MBE8165466.1 hypothetical protein [Leptospira borgpetersenii serovar Ballum]MBE8170912.1 hypothetical protein [Leptospira borgpetersenii serovar Ballum]MBE8174090.1 hypothetical protein [Leptospira borgpetersenii serovar Ballum]